MTASPDVIPISLPALGEWARQLGAWEPPGAPMAVRAVEPRPTLQTSPGHLHLRRTVTLRASPEVLWPLLADTERINRMMGAGPVTYDPNPAAGAARLIAHTRNLGIRYDYLELPFEWQAPRWFMSQRIPLGGPVVSFRFFVELVPLADGGTEARAEVLAGVRSAWAWPLLRFSVGRMLDRMVRGYRAIDDALAAGSTAPVHRQSAAELERLELHRARLAERYPAELVERLLGLLREGGDADLLRIRPFELADGWGVPEDQALSMCLDATHAGLLELRWDIVCPSCLTASQRVASLSRLGPGGHCPACDLSFELDLATAVEVTFRPHPSVRPVEEVTYCIGGPRRTPHALAQLIIPTGESRAMVAPEREGRYRLFNRGGARAVVQVERGASARAEVEVGADAFSAGLLVIQPGGELCLTNASGEDRHVKLEYQEWASRAATGQRVLALPRFRRLFSHEALAPGVMLRVSQVTFLFSDLVGSTSLYEEIGDAAAYRLVAEHFQVLTSAVEGQGGAVVKTMGDAVMAVFNDPSAAARAAEAIVRGFEGFRLRHPNAHKVGIKVGVHGGPSFAVTANGALDYFGQTVNTAARVQGQSGAGEVVMTQELAEALEREGGLAGLVATERFERTLKGVTAPVGLVRYRRVPVTPPSPGTSA